MNNSNLPIFQYSTGYAGKFAGVVGDDNQAVGVGNSSDVQVVEASRVAWAGKGSADIAVMFSGAVVKR